MRLSALLLTLFWAIAPSIQAHPSVALVMDSRGAIYYSDLTHVWMLQPDGTKRIAVHDVHTHELWLGPDDSLYGEDVSNLGEQYRHRLWRLHPNGTLTDVLPWRKGHPVDFYDYSFARDSQGRSYVLRRNPNRIDILNAGQRVPSLALDALPGLPGWLIVNGAGVTHFTMGPSLWRWHPPAPQATRVADNLIERTDAFDFVHDRHALMGLWSDTEGAVYVAVFAGQVVKRIDTDGTVTVVARSEGAWSPAGGLMGPDGALWLLEWSSSNQVRIRRINPDGSECIF